MNSEQSADDRLGEIAGLYWAQDAVIDVVMGKARTGGTEIYHLLMAVQAIHQRIGEFAGAEL